MTESPPKWFMLSYCAATLAVIGIAITVPIVNFKRDTAQGSLYNNLAYKVNASADVNKSGRIDFEEGLAVLGESHSRADAEKIIVDWGYRPTIPEMQTYLKSKGIFDEKIDDLRLSEERKQRRYAFVAQP